MHTCSLLNAYFEYLIQSQQVYQSLGEIQFASDCVELQLFTVGQYLEQDTILNQCFSLFQTAFQKGVDLSQISGSSAYLEAMCSVIRVLHGEPQAVESYISSLIGNEQAPSNQQQCIRLW